MRRLDGRTEPLTEGRSENNTGAETEANVCLETVAKEDDEEALLAKLLGKRLCNVDSMVSQVD